MISILKLDVRVDTVVRCLLKEMGTGTHQKRTPIHRG